MFELIIAVLVIAAAVLAIRYIISHAKPASAAALAAAASTESKIVTTVGTDISKSKNEIEKL